MFASAIKVVILWGKFEYIKQMLKQTTFSGQKLLEEYGLGLLLHGNKQQQKYICRIDSLPTGKFCMLFCCLLIYIKMNFVEKFFQEYHQSVKQFRFRSGSKLFAMLSA